MAGAAVVPQSARPSVARRAPIEQVAIITEPIFRSELQCWVLCRLAGIITETAAFNLSACKAFYLVRTPHGDNAQFGDTTTAVLLTVADAGRVVINEACRRYRSIREVRLRGIGSCDQNARVTARTLNATGERISRKHIGPFSKAE